MAQFLSTSITGSLTLSGSLTPITFPGTNARIEMGDPSGTDYAMVFKSNRYYYFNDDRALYVQGVIIPRNGIRDDGGPLALGHKSTNIMYLSGSSVGIGTSTPSRKLSVEGNAYVKDQFAVDATNPGTNLTQDSQIKIQSRGNQAGTIRSSQWYLETDSNSIYGNSAFTINQNYDGGSQNEYFRISSAGDVTIKQDLTVEGIVTAQEFHTEFVSASIVFSSGSTQFGDTDDDNHDFRGQVHIYRNVTTGPIATPTLANAGLRIQDSGANMYIDGNTIKLDNAGHLTTSGNNSFEIGTNNTPRIHIAGDGNVGIGTTSPLYKLHVAGEGLFQSDIIISGSSPAIKFNEVGQATNEAYLGIGGQKMTIYTGRTGTSRNDLWLRVGDSANSSTPTIFATGSNGYVGIGNEAPARRLHIGGTGGSGGGIMLSPSSGDIEIQFQDSGTTNAYITLKDGTQQMRLRDDSANVLNIDFGTERVGIMTTAPTVALQVEGDVSASGYLKGDTLYALNDVVVADQILHYGDTDTNISFTDDQIVLNAGNVEFLRLSEGLSDQLIINEAGAALDLRVEGDTDTNLIRTDAANDRVGIGTASPTEKLTVGGNLRVVTSGTTYLKLRGSGDNYDLNLQSTQDEFILSRGSTEHFRIDSNGNTGINVSAPTHKLHVSGTYDVVKIEGSGSANSSSLFEVHGNNGLLFAIDDDLSDSLFSVNTIAGLPVIEAFSDNRVVMGAFNQNDFVISGSKVGIGTDSPTSQLEIGDPNTAGTGITVAAQYNLSNAFLRFRSGHPSNTNIWETANISATDDGNYNGRIHFRTSTSGQAAPTDKMVIKANGNVGIGTTAPSQKLEVRDGNIVVSGSTSEVALGTATGVPRMHSNSSNDLLFSTATQTNVLYLQEANGRVGVGTTSPTKALTIEGDVSASGIFYGNASGLTNVPLTATLNQVLANGNEATSYNINMNNNDITAVDEIAVNIVNGISASLSYVTASANLHIDTNVGIGTASPQKPLHVSSNNDAPIRVESTDATTGILFVDPNSSNALYYVGSGDSFYTSAKLGIGQAPSRDLHVKKANSGGQVRLEVFNSSNTANSHGIVSIYSGGASGGDPFLHWKIDVQQDWSMGIDNSDGDKLKISNNFGPGTNDYLTVDTAGNVGIGTTSPTEKLHVDGNLLVTGIVTAQEFHTEFVSASIVFSSGSTKFGNSTDDNHDFTGSLRATSTGTAADPVLDIINTSSTTFNHSIEVMTPNMTAGENNIIVIGRASSTKNSGYIGYKYSSAGANANVLTFGHWGSDNLMNLTGDGKLGIGTQTPATLLHLSSSAASVIKIETEASGQGSPQLYIEGNKGGSANAMSTVVEIKGNIDARGRGIIHTSDNDNVQWFAGVPYNGGAYQIGYDASGNNIPYYVASSSLSILASGNVGIGTASPGMKLHVDGGDIKINNSTNGTTPGVYITNAGITGNQTQLYSDTSGTPISVLRSTERALWIQANSSAGGGASNDLRLYANGNLGLAVDHSGSVGIGTTTPAQKLHVAGNAEFDGNLYVNEYVFHNDDTNTYMRFLGDYIRFNAGGVEMLTMTEGSNDTVHVNAGGVDVNFQVSTNNDNHTLFVDGGSDKVGIGEVSPQAKLHVSGTNDVLLVEGSGSTIFDVQGSQGQLFSVTDSLVGSLFSVNDISGLPILEVFDTDKVVAGTFGQNTLVVTGSNVGIGTDSPSEKLEVNGSIKLPSTTGEGIKFVGGSAPSGLTWYTAGGVSDGPQLISYGSAHVIIDSDSNDADTRFFSVSKNGTNYGNATELFRVQENGNVGIGTSSPASKLTVGGNATGFATAMQVWQNGETALSGDIGGKAATFFGTSGLSNSSIVNIYSTGAYTGQTGGEIGFGGKYASGGNVAQFAKIRSFKTNASSGGANYGGGLEFWTRPNGSSAVPRLTILGDGNVGIGTSSPASKLDVRGDILASGSNAKFVFDDPGYSYTHDLDLRGPGQGQLHYKYGGGTKVYFDNHSIRFGDWGSGTGTNANTQDPRIGKGTTNTIGDLVFTTNNIDRMFISGSGPVGIGTTSPGYTLDINGSMHSTNITIADAIYHEGDTNTYIQFNANDNIRLVTGGGERFKVTDSLVTSTQNVRIKGGAILELGQPGESDDNGRTVLIEGKANAGTGEASGRIFFSENNTTATNSYGLSLYYEGDGNAALPSGFQPNTGNATWSLRRHDNSVNGAAIMSGIRTSNNVTFSGDVTSTASILGNSLYTSQYIYHTGDTDTLIRFQTNDINLTAGGNNLFRVDGNSSQKTVVVNEAGIDLDFRVESDTVDHALFVEGATGNVGIGTASPGATLTVNGNIEATEKSFNIEHPTKPGKRLIYGVLEGPEHGVYVRGKSTEKVIELPEVWTGLVHDDSITVQLTCKGKPFTIWVEDIRDNKVYINTDTTDFEFYYYIQGERKDVDKLIIERDAN